MKSVQKRTVPWAKCPVHSTFLMLIAGLTITTGCGDGANTYPVRGTVVHEGEALDRGTVLFNPVDADLSPSRAAIQFDGTYELSAAPGEYKITINLFTETDPNLEPDDPGYEEPESLLPKEYSSLTRTPLKGAVEEKSENVIDLEL